MNAHEFKPPTDIWQVNQQLHYDEALDADDPRFVHTEAGRGDFSFTRLLRMFGVKTNPDEKLWELASQPRNVNAVFCGHRGCGKSTELRRLGKKLHRNDLFFVVSLDIVEELDPHDLQYPEIFLALAHRLCATLADNNVEIDEVLLANLRSWFDERIEVHDSTRVLASELKTGIQSKAGLPFLAELFAGLSLSFKTNSTYKEELRSIIKNSYSQFARAFQQLLLAAEAAIDNHGLGKALLFIIDGTDRLDEQDSRRLFIDDVYQLQQIQGNFIYCAPIQMIYAGNQLQQSFQRFVLPMIKLTDKTGQKRNECGYDVLRELVNQRADPALFDKPDTLDYLIQYSGGSLRELIRLLSYAFQESKTDLFDRAAAEAAVKELATDYLRFLSGEDYKILYEIDHNPDTDHQQSSERTRFLLLNLALLEYNGFWWRSHPAVQTLASYQRLSHSN